MCEDMRITKILIMAFLLVMVHQLIYAADPCERLIPTTLHATLKKRFPEYRIAKSIDQKTNDPEWDKYNNKEQQCLTVASGDFDGDDKVDFASFIVKKGTSTPKLIVALWRNRNWSINELPIWNQHIAGCYVETTEPGTYEHTMSYEFKSSNTNERERVTAKNTSIIAGRVESTGVVYVYDKDHWLYVWVSD
jgi:hypothetical protein